MARSKRSVLPAAAVIVLVPGWFAWASEPAAPHEKHAGAYAAWCGLHFGLQEFGLAIEDCDEALKADPTSAQNLSNRGSSQFMLGKLDSADADFQAALELAPDQPDLHFNLGAILSVKGEHRAAIERYTMSLQLNPNFAPAFVNRGNAFDQLGEREKAIVDYKTALELVPSMTAVRRRLKVLEGN